MLSLTLSWQPCSLSQRIRHSSRLEAFHDPPFPGKTEPSFSSCHSTPAPAAETTHCPQRCPNDVAAEGLPFWKPFLSPPLSARYGHDQVLLLRQSQGLPLLGPEGGGLRTPPLTSVFHWLRHLDPEMNAYVKDDRAVPPAVNLLLKLYLRKKPDYV